MKRVLIREAEARRLLRVPEWTLIKLERRGLLNPIRVSGGWAYDSAEIARLAETDPRKGPRHEP
jgi:hypothetical protein